MKTASAKILLSFFISPWVRVTSNKTCRTIQLIFIYMLRIFFYPEYKPSARLPINLLLEVKITVVDFAKQKETGGGQTPPVFLRIQININHV